MILGTFVVCLSLILLTAKAVSMIRSLVIVLGKLIRVLVHLHMLK